MNRRNTLKLLIAASLGTSTLGYWSLGQAEINRLVSESAFSNTDHDLINSIADTIIPESDGFGALVLGVPVYLIGYFNKCIEPDVQSNLKQQLNALESKAIDSHQKSFIACSQAQREVLFLSFADSEIEAENAFFELIKKQTVHGFRTSKEVMTGPYHYQIAPGHYKGCIDINAEFTT